MGTELRYPNITGVNEREMVVQMKSYLYQLVDQLQYALNNVGASPVTYVVQKVGVRQANSGGGEAVAASLSDDPVAAFNDIKALIIKSADIVNAYYEEISKRLAEVYVAESDFGTFVEKTEGDIKATSTYVEQKYQDVQAIISNEIDGVRVSIDEGMSDLNNTFNSALGNTESRLTGVIDGKIEAVNKQIDGVNESIENTDGEIVKTNARIDDANEAITETNARIDEANAKIGEVEDAIADTNSRIDWVNASIAATNEEIMGANGRISEANSKIDNLTDVIEDTNANIDVLIEAKDLNKEDVEKLNTEIGKINGSISDINNTVETIDTEVKAIDGHVTEVDGQVEVINNAVINVENTTAELADTVVNVENSLQDTNAKVDATSGAVGNLNEAVEETTGKVEEINSAIADVNSNIEGIRASILEANAYIRSGLLYYADNAFPVYGLEIGQRNKVNGEEVFNKFARFTADRLSFYDQNDSEVAYISDYKLYIRNVEITSNYKIGGFVDTVTSSGGVVTKWVGRG